MKQTYQGRSRQAIGLVAGIAMGCAMLLGAQVPRASAGGPPGATTGTGVSIDPNGPRTPAARGYTQAYADAKGAQLAQAMQKRSSAFASTGGVAPLSSTGQNYLSYWTQYHQKTQYPCLPADGQSILAWNFGRATYVGSSVASSQAVIARSMSTTSLGTDDYKAFSYINSQFSRWSSPFRYVPINDTSLSGYETRIVYEIDSFQEPLYTRVDVSSPYYVWHQRNYALHATLSVGYWSSGAQVTIGDPYTASTSGCPEGIGYPGYSATPDQGCIYFGYSASSYYRAKSGVVQSELPEQY